MNRREFIQNIVRGGIFLSLSALTGFLVLKEETGEACDLDFVCKNCKRNKICTLDEGKAYRKE